MGLVFSVANPDDVFVESYARKVRVALEKLFKKQVVLDSQDEPYYSTELGWSGWGLLQERSCDLLGEDALPAFLSMEAWNGCYVPCETKPRAVTIEGQDTPLSIASLAALTVELEAIGKALKLATDNEGLAELAEKYNDDDFIEDDMDVQTFVHLLLAAREAEDRRQALWIVK